MKVAFDTNILAYAEGINGIAMKREALELVEALPEGSAMIPVQVLGELFNVLVRKAGRTREKARKAVQSWHDAFSAIETSSEVLVAAADLATEHQLGIWDAVVISAAAEARCRLLLTQDLHEGFTWRGVTVTNPFLNPRHALLADLISSTRPQ